MSRWPVLVPLAAVAAIHLACASGPETPEPPPVVSQLDLPAEITFPEGIAYDANANVIYTASAADGTLARVPLGDGEPAVVAAAGVLMPPGTTTFPGILGMKIDGQRRLWIAGGSLGRMFVVDATTGTVLKQFQVPTSGSLINDAAISGMAVYFTDTINPTLWRVSADGDAIGELEPWIQFEGTPLQYGEGANLNGIAATPDGRSLIVVQMAKGLLFEIDIASKAVTPIDTAGEDLSGADGLVLDGSTLYVVRQTAQQIATVELSDDLSRGTVTSRFADPMLTWPATAAKVDDALLVVNTQFNRRGDNSQTLPFTIARVPVALLHPASGD